MKHLVIFRTSCAIIDINSYNCQEIGLAKALSKDLKISIILAGKKYKHRILFHNDKEINIYFLPIFAINQSLGILKGWERLLKKISPDFVQIHEFGILMSALVVKWAKKYNIPSFLIQGNYQTTLKPIFRQLEIIYNHTIGRYVLNNVNGIGCKTLMASRYIHKYCSRKTILTYVGIDTSIFQDSFLIDWKKMYNIEGKHILLYVGKLEERRNPLFLVDIISQLSSDFVLLLVGEGPLEKEIRHKIKELNLQNRCILLGKLKQEELPSLYKISDIFLLASNYEIYGMVILETMYFELPIISSLTAGSETLIETGKDGIIIKEFDVKKWVNTINNICKNKKKLKLMGELACYKIKNSMTWDNTSKTYLKLYLDNHNVSL